ncbi:MAG: hypothetical protein NDI67_10885 [Sulfuritalea sp.]|nr:hypothetical protein [Sulfuritalea sp.]
MSSGRLSAVLVACFLLLPRLVDPVYAARTSDVRSTLHNLSSAGPGTVKAAGESEVCVFCHTPHGADTSQTPLWNKTLAAKTYTPYTSNSLDAETIKNASLDQPMGSSKLCLSCHDGAMALGSVRVLRGVNNPATISVGGTGTGGIMPPGSGTTTGYTRNIGAGSLDQTTGFDLTNDHPISLTYDAALASRDGELRSMNASQQSPILINSTHPLFGKRAAGQSASRPVLPLEPTGTSGAGQVQCTTCHDPHLKGDASDITAEGNIKFLRRPRVQTVQPTYVDGQAVYGDSGNIICLACHDKGLQGMGGNSWNYSAHANSQVATQTYTEAAATTRGFPTTIQVWQASCLNCHDTHTVTGSRRLLREGTDATPGTALYLGGFKAGGSSALEETCYQCHRDAANSILSSSTSVPDIRTDFNIVGGYRMPITSADQDAGGVEMHDPGSGRAGFNDGYAGGVVNGLTTSGSNCSAASNDKCGADLIESRALLGTTATNRHVECTDCHNPHRVAKFKLFFGNSGDLSGAGDTQGGTHEHTDTAMTHTNVASGVLRGTWGVEPSYSSNSFHASASNYTVRRGDPGSETVSTAMPLNNAGGTVGGTTFNAMDTKGFVTREYQVCLKCHSTYGYTTPPDLRAAASRRGLTPAGTVATPGVGNALTQYTDQAKEFQAPDSHADESTGTTAVNLGTDGGAIGYNANNHRSWHPVMRSTGRTASKRSLTATSAFRTPFSAAVGTQTMYCSDCHGSNVTLANSVIPDGTNITTGAGSPWGPHGSANPFILKGTWNKDSSTSSAPLCLKCHNPTSSSGFSGSKGNLHQYHIDRGASPLQCTWCHIAVPHGWKNKALLVNLNDVGEEAGFAAGSSFEVAIGGNSNNYTKAPYYLEAKNKIRTFARAGNWEDTACGTANKTGANLIANNQGSTANSTSPVSGKDWMTNMCGNPP